MSPTLPHLSTLLPPEFFSGDILNPSTESESDDDDVTGLTRRFTRSVSFQERFIPLLQKRGFSGSPEPTLNRNVSQTRSFPTTPFGRTANEDCWDLIYAAAEQVARMKMNMNMNTTNDCVFANRGLRGAPLSHNHHFPHLLSEKEEILRRLQFRRRVDSCGSYHCDGRCGTGGPVGLPQAAWPAVPLENQRRQQPVSGCGVAGVKKERAGTGVFLPRNYSHVPPAPKKTSGCSPNYVRAGVAQSLNKNMDPINGLASWCKVPPPPHHFNRDELAELNAARRNAVMLAQQRSAHPEVLLPQEWTY